MQALRSWGKQALGDLKKDFAARQAATKIPPSKWLYRSFQGRAEHPTLARLRSEGWEVTGESPVMIGGTTLPKQRLWSLRKLNPEYREPQGS